MYSKPNAAIRPGLSYPLGATFDGEGVNFAVFSDNATAIEVCIFEEQKQRELIRYTLPERTGGIWHGYVKGLRPGTLYGLRAHGAYDPHHGHRFNPNKLLLDPYAREIRGVFGSYDLLAGHNPRSEVEDLSYSTKDSASAMPKAVIVDNLPFVDEQRRPRVPLSETIIYEAHPKGLTQLFPNLPPNIAGTYEALGHPEVIAYLKDLGVTTIELLPVHCLLNDSWLVERGLSNYWGYNTANFFALEPRYFGPRGVQGFREAVGILHDNGLEVILDVVYNHTAEGDQRGPTLSFRGLDNASYYLLLQGQSRYYVNDTGCGNTLNVAHPMVTRLVLDSLRWWVQSYGIDGFRFDLATTLGREVHGFDTHGGFFDALRQDPVLSRVKLFAEPWDIGPGGYQLGAFPTPFAEWNDAYRDTVRRFWRGDPHSAQELAERLLGSAGTFDRNGRPSWSSVNFVACHDGFTLKDVVSYRHKQNEANQEDNRDGHNENYSDNCDVEGPAKDPTVQERRALRMRNMLTTVLVSQGIPMLLAGDEIGNTQHGNNNAYCQDNELSWVKWPDADQGLYEFVKQLIRLRKTHKVLRQRRFLHARKRASDGFPDVEWLGFDGSEVNWRDPQLKRFCLVIRESAEANSHLADDDVLAIAFNGSFSAGLLRMPSRQGGRPWMRFIDTSKPSLVPEMCPDGRSQRIVAQSIVVFRPSPRSDAE